MGLLTRDEQKTLRASVAGVLLCSRTPEAWLPNAVIMATRYRGGDRATGQADAQTITGPLDRQIAHAVAFALRNMRVSARKEPARVDEPEYSERAIFEALVNAAAHRDYSIRGSRIQLAMFNDRLEIQSPGSLPNDLTVDSLPLRQSARNELLVSVLGRMPAGHVPGSGDRRFFMERRGDGVPTIVRETKALSGESAEFRLVDDAELCVVLPAAPVEPSPRPPCRHRAGRRRRAAARAPTCWCCFRTGRGSAPRPTRRARPSSTCGTTALPMTVFVAAPGYAAHLEQAWRPDRGALAVVLDPRPDGGSVIFPEATGNLPGLAGALNPVRDAHDRLCLYASNIVVNEGQTQPVPFVPGEELRLTDAGGRELLVRIAGADRPVGARGVSFGGAMTISAEYPRRCIRMLEAAFDALRDHESDDVARGHLPRRVRQAVRTRARGRAAGCCRNACAPGSPATGRPTASPSRTCSATPPSTP